MRTYRTALRGFLAFAGACAFALAAQAQVWNEDGDAGSFPETAQVVGSLSGGPLTRIVGTTNSAQNDDIDVYLIRISDPENFEAWTASAGGGFANFDTRLFLFDEEGGGLLANEDHDFGDFQSYLLSSADDGTGQVIPAPGLYYLAVAGFDMDPRASGSRPLFSFGSVIEISGPDGPGGAAPLFDWWIPTGDSGAYGIALSGAEFVVEYPPGDMNCDGALDGADIDPFFLALGNPAEYRIAFPSCNLLNGDINGDNSLDGADIDGFFACLGGHCE